MNKIYRTQSEHKYNTYIYTYVRDALSISSTIYLILYIWLYFFCVLHKPESYKILHAYCNVVSVIMNGNLNISFHEHMTWKLWKAKLYHSLQWSNFQNYSCIESQTDTRNYKLKKFMCPPTTIELLFKWAIIDTCWHLLYEMSRILVISG